MKLTLAALLVAALAGLQAPERGPSPIRYRFTFPQPEHHWMQVEGAFTGLEAAPLELRMSRSSPGRYSLHDFAKNVYDVHAFGASGEELAVERPDPYGWTIATHGSTVTVRYKVFGDRIDGTYLGIDTTHAHINMPAAVMWARGLDDRPSALTFEPPRGRRWTVATQLHPGATPFEFTAPNLQYLMDSPAEFGPVLMRQFVVDGRTFRVAAHHTGTPEDLDRFARDVSRIVEREREIFGELPRFEPGAYTFLADFVPQANVDGMEHRNSTVMTSPLTIRSGNADLLETAAHEFFHAWNVERIRPRSLEPFNFEQVNSSGELWLAEGFTQYYGPLTLSRVGLEDLTSTLATFGALIETVSVKPGARLRSAEEMSRMAAFTDGGLPGDPTNWSDTYVSYYPFGAAIALALDLSLREKTAGRVTLDDFMRAMWRVHGGSSSREGYVDRPYTIEDVEARLAETSGDRAFAADFIRRYVRGRELPDYARLLAAAGLVLRPTRPGVAWWGDFGLERRDGLRLSSAPLSNTPAYKAGLDAGDDVRSVDGVRVSSFDDVMAIVRRHKPGDTVKVEFVDRGDAVISAAVELAQDPHLEVVPVERAGGTLTESQRAFRASWLNNGPRASGIPPVARARSGELGRDRAVAPSAPRRARLVRSP